MCPHCGAGAQSFTIGGPKLSHRAGLRHCKCCRKQFSVTVGTALERTRVSFVNWMRLAYLLSMASGNAITVPEIVEVLDVPYKTAERMLDRVCNALITYKGLANQKRFGAVITRYITQAARSPQPRLKHPQHPSSPTVRKHLAMRYANWKKRLKLDPTLTPDPQRFVEALSAPGDTGKHIRRVINLLLLLLNADVDEVQAANKLRLKRPRHRRSIHNARIRLPNSRATV